MSNRTFVNEYKLYKFDICTYCNLYQTKSKFLQSVNLTHTIAYSFRCQHCKKIYVVEILYETLQELGRTSHNGFNNFIIPGYEEDVNKCNIRRLYL